MEKQEKIRIMIQVSLFIVMITISIIIIVDGTNTAKEADNYYIKQFNNQTWVDSLNCNDVKNVIIGASNTFTFKPESKPLFEKWYSTHCEMKKDLVK